MRGEHSPLASPNPYDELLTEVMGLQAMPHDLPEATLAFIEDRRRNESATPATLRGDTAGAHVVAVPHRARRMSRRGFVRLAAAALAVGACCAAGVSFADETAQVSVEGACWIELGLNRWNRVVRIDASSSEIAQLVDGLGVWGLEGTDALERIASSDALRERLGADGETSLVAACANEAQLDGVLTACNRCAGLFGENTRCYAAGESVGRGSHGQGQGQGRGQQHRGWRAGEAG